MRPLRFWQVDAFTRQPFTGNPAAVFVLHEAPTDELMQNIAIEMNLSETAFVLIGKGRKPTLRWFTITVEVDLCGHATLASAHIYMTEVRPDLSAVTFDTKFVGPLKVEKAGAGYRMDFPSRLGQRQELDEIPDFVLQALNPHARPHTAYKSRDLMLVYDDEQIIHDIDPDANALKRYKDSIIVTAKATDYDFISRFLSYNDGVREDPVTGSAHCTLGPYWAQQLGKRDLKAYQASKRGGELGLHVTKERIFIAGEAITIVDGTMRM